jgi:hypothetical protein
LRTREGEFHQPGNGWRPGAAAESGKSVVFHARTAG